MPKSRTRQTVAIVEDDPSVRKALQRLLRLAGFELQVFPSAEVLLERGTPDVFGCFIIDIDLPGMSGFELHEALAEAGLQAPTIFMTAYDDQSVRECAGRKTNSIYLSKPFPSAALLDAVTRALGGANGKDKEN